MCPAGAILVLLQSVVVVTESFSGIDEKSLFEAEPLCRMKPAPLELASVRGRSNKAGAVFVSNESWQTSGEL